MYYTKIKVHIYNICQHNHINKWGVCPRVWWDLLCYCSKCLGWTTLANKTCCIEHLNLCLCLCAFQRSAVLDTNHWRQRGQVWDVGWKFQHQPIALQITVVTYFSDHHHMHVWVCVHAYLSVSIMPYSIAPLCRIAASVNWNFSIPASDL